MALIEIDGLPNLKMGIFHGELLNKPPFIDGLPNLKMGGSFHGEL